MRTVALGSAVTYLPQNTAAKIPFSLSGIANGLALGTTYWIDAGIAYVTGGTANIENVYLTSKELK